jgi:glutathione synthase
MPETKIGLIVNTVTELKYHNFLIFSNALLKAGYQPVLILADSLSLLENKIIALCHKISVPLDIGTSIDKECFEKYEINNFDYIWVLAFGRRQNFLDIIEFLWILEKYGHGEFINSVDSLMYFNNKYILNFLPNFIKTPKTYASNDAEYLYEMVCANDQKEWILKPPAESMGRNVFILKNGDTNRKVLTQMMTGNKAKKYCILQEFISEITEKGEKRVLIARGEIICSYTRTPQEDDHRTNLHQGSEPIVSELTAEEKKYCLKIAKYFKEIGVNYIGLDMVFPYILEVNVVNPGGLNTIQEISGIDYSVNVIEKLIENKT